MTGFDTAKLIKASKIRIPQLPPKISFSLFNLRSSLLVVPTIFLCENLQKTLIYISFFIRPR